jgi:hypothetical protein
MATAVATLTRNRSRSPFIDGIAIFVDGFSDATVPIRLIHIDPRLLVHVRTYLISFKWAPVGCFSPSDPRSPRHRGRTQDTTCQRCLNRRFEKVDAPGQQHKRNEEKKPPDSPYSVVSSGRRQIRWRAKEIQKLTDQVVRLSQCNESQETVRVPRWRGPHLHSIMSGKSYVKIVQPVTMSHSFS